MTPQFRSQPAPIDKAWEMVRRWPGMRGEDKLAWRFLWERSACGRQRVDVTAGELGADQGVTSDAGRARIRNLAAVGLIGTQPRNRAEASTGVYAITVLDPFVVSRARAIRWDGQFTLPFLAEPTDEPTAVQGPSVTSGTPGEHAPLCPADTDVCRPAAAVAEDPPEEPPEDPTEVPRSKGFEPFNKYLASPLKPFPLIHSEGLETKATEEAPEVPRRPVPRDAAANLSELSYWVRRIEALVGCKNLYRGAARSAARAVLEARISESDMNEILEDVERKRRLGKLATTPSAYFNGAIRKRLSGKPE